jgi:hypothetical protein
MSTTSAQQRKAWNEAMRTAAGTAALPSALQTTQRKRRSDRHNNNNNSNSLNSKQGRRDRARKILSQEESHEYRAAAWMDALEDVPATVGIDGGDNVVDQDDSYDELEELEDETKGASSKRKRKRKSTAATKASGSAGTIISMPKRFKPRSLASILLEEVNRDDGVAYIWLDNEARINKKNKQAAHVTIMPPPRKYCPVTGMEGIYTEPKSRIPYANLQALEQIRERSPPWMTLGGNIAYHEAAKSIRDEEE